MNEFTLENTKGASYLSIVSGCFISGGHDVIPQYWIDLTDQTDRGYPTLEWFLGCGFKLEAGDKWYDRERKLTQVGANEVIAMNLANPVNKTCYVKSLHDNRHDLTAMARDEYYSNIVKPIKLSEHPLKNEVVDKINSGEITFSAPNGEKQWPDNDRIDAIGQNGNNGEHYASKPVYTQEMYDNGELPPVGCKVELNRSINDLGTCTVWESGHILECLAHRRCPLTGSVDDVLAVFWNETTEEASTVNVRNIKLIDTRTEEEKLRDELLKAIDGHVMRRSRIVSRLIESNKFTITLNEGE